MEVVQWPDRVLLRYEKDDQLRTVWMDGREPSVKDYGLQGLSVGKYDGDALIVTTTHFLFEGKPYFWVSDRRAAELELQSLR